MRFLCRIGWHKWGKWSKPWYIKSTDYYAFEVFKVIRSLKCECCAAYKHVWLSTHGSLGSLHVEIEPKWE